MSLKLWTYLLLLGSVVGFGQYQDLGEKAKQHGTSFFVTPAQKKTLDCISSATPWVWFGGFALAVAVILVGAAARLRLPTTNRTM